jgi:DNA processing protein
VQDTDPIVAPTSAAEWIRLAETPGVGPVTAARLLHEFASPARIFGAGADALEAAGASRAAARALCQPLPDPAARRLDAALAWLERPGHHLLTLAGPGYPALLAAVYAPPTLLYAAGFPELLAAPGVAIVGSRNATTQGKANAAAFAEALSAAGITIVSGLALGIDAAAHAGGLRAAGSTVAVLGTGPDIVYPHANRALAQRIAAEGCVVSECSLGTPPERTGFPRRNRIISGLAAGVLVVEAAARSGSLITAHLAGEQGRDVFALPGSVHAPLAKGCHQLIREGAQLVETADEILAALQRSPLASARYRPDGAARDRPLAGHAALLAAMGYEPVDTDTLAALGAGDPAELSGQLLTLELAGQVERLPGGLFQRLIR